MKLRAQWILISFVVKVSREEYTNFSAFRRLGLLPQVFRQVKEHLILQLHEMIRVLHEVAYPIVFLFFFYDRYWQGGVLKLMKYHHFFSIFSRFGLFSQVF